MATALSLSQAAGQAFDNLEVWWETDQMQSRIVLFCAQTLPLFPQGQPTNNPVSNWITVFWSVGAVMPSADVPIMQLTDASEILYRLCWMADFLTGNGITSGQAASLLALYNAIIGF